jgi:predicted transcriptional regulator
MNGRVYIITTVIHGKATEICLYFKSFRATTFFLPLRTLSDFEAGIQADVHKVGAQAVNSYSFYNQRLTVLKRTQFSSGIFFCFLFLSFFLSPTSSVYSF